jgi:mRNA-degrading endonuclease RelE of RelBE toxin-antitoxin system
MPKKIAWTGQAKADVRAIDQLTAMQILHVLARFTMTEEGDVKRLRDIDPPQYRLRARFYDHGGSIEIVAVKHRRQAYR